MQPFKNNASITLMDLLNFLGASNQPLNQPFLRKSKKIIFVNVYMHFLQTNKIDHSN